MRKIKVYLKYPWKVSDSPYYQYLIKNPPEGILYVNVTDPKIIRSGKKFSLNNWLKRMIKKMVRGISYSIPNAHFTITNKKYDIIHCAHCLSLNNKPWVADIEFANQFWASYRAIKEKRKNVLRILKKENCKRILAWTEWSKNGILEVFPEINDKIEVIYPSFPLPRLKKKKRNKIILLHISRLFYLKGGLHTLEVFDRLTKKYKNVEGIIVSDIPKEIIKKYSKNKKIKIYGLKSKKELFEKFYPAADIFIYPTYSDTLGFALIEAQGFGLPIVTIEGHSRREIVQDKKTGFILDYPKKVDYEKIKGQGKIIKNIQNKTELLIRNKKLREKMSRNARKEVAEGKFSIKKRNKKLKKIYSEALK